jgi:hypothetical protein
MLDLMGVQKVRWEGGGSELARENTFSSKNGMDHELGTGVFVHN